MPSQAFWLEIADLEYLIKLRLGYSHGLRGLGVAFHSKDCCLLRGWSLGLWGCFQHQSVVTTPPHYYVRQLLTTNSIW